MVRGKEILTSIFRKRNTDEQVTNLPAKPMLKPVSARFVVTHRLPTLEQHESIVREDSHYRDPNKQPFIKDDVRFEGPRFMIIRGAEIGYHCHLSLYIGRVDTGVLLTLKDMDVYAQIHRKGKIKKAFDIESIGESEKTWLVNEVWEQIGRFPQEARRMPGENAFLLGTFEVPLPNDIKLRSRNY